MAYEFHYTPTGTGVISGKEVLEQTEDAINDLSGQISGDVQIAIDTANNALNTANTASADAQNAVNTASTAYTAATNAQNTANTAQNTASNALTAAQNAQNDVNALGNRVTTAEGNITQNTNAITGLTTRMGTAEGNIGNLQTAVSNAQATANSAQQTATTARQQSYVFRYSSTALVASSTNSNSLLDNTDNLKVGDKVIDSDGVLFSITAIDTANSTFTIGSALVDLALDANVMHLSGNETADGYKTFLKYITSDGSYMGDEYSPNTRTNLWLMGNRDTEEVSGILFDTFRQNTAQGTGSHLLGICIKENAVRYEGCRFAWSWDNNLNGYAFSIKPTLQGTNQAVEHNLGTSTDKWSKVFGLQYYYGSTAVEFSQKFVTTDTDQSIAGNKTFSNFISSDGSYLGNEASTNQRTNLCLRANRDTAGQSGCYVTRYRQNKAQGALAFSDQQQLGIDFLENSVRTTNLFNIVATDWTNDVPGRILINSGISNNSFGSVTRKCLINELNPGSLSLPDLNNGIDISGYFTVGTTSNTYTALADGYISILTTATSNSAIYWSDSNGIIGDIAFSAVDLAGTNRVTNITFPVNKGVTYIIVFKSVTNIESAKFFPCLGNV